MDIELPIKYIMELRGQVTKHHVNQLAVIEAALFTLADELRRAKQKHAEQLATLRIDVIALCYELDIELDSTDKCGEE